MGSDLHFMADRAMERDGGRYRLLRAELGALLGIAVQHDVINPGDHRPTDRVLVDAVATLIVERERKR